MTSFLVCDISESTANFVWPHNAIGNSVQASHHILQVVQALFVDFEMSRRSTSPSPLGSSNHLQGAGKDASMKAHGIVNRAGYEQRSCLRILILESRLSTDEEILFDKPACGNGGPLVPFLPFLPLLLLLKSLPKAMTILRMPSRAPVKRLRPLLLQLLI